MNRSLKVSIVKDHMSLCTWDSPCLCLLSQINFNSFSFTFKRRYIFGWMIHCMADPLKAIAKESGFLVRGRHIVFEGFQQESVLI